MPKNSLCRPLLYQLPRGSVSRNVTCGQITIELARSFWLSRAVLFGSTIDETVFYLLLTLCLEQKSKNKMEIWDWYSGVTPFYFWQKFLPGNINTLFNKIVSQINCSPKFLKICSLFYNRVLSVKVIQSVSGMALQGKREEELTGKVSKRA